MSQTMICLCKKVLPNLGALIRHASKCESGTKTFSEFLASTNACLDDVLFAEDYNEGVKDLARSIGTAGIYIYSTMDKFLAENDSEPLTAQPEEI